MSNPKTTEINLLTAKPYIFTRDNQRKFGLQTDNEFLWITQTINSEGIHSICVPMEGRDKTPVYNHMTKEDLENEGLYGFSLQLALEWTKIAPPRPATGTVKN